MDALRQDVPVTWSLPAVLVPEAGDRGLASAAPEALAQRTLAAWDACIELAGSVDPTTPVRHSIAGAEFAALGTWPGTRTLDDMRADAVAGHTTIPDRAAPDIPEHPSGAELTTALQLSRDNLATWLEGPATGDHGWQAEGLLITPTIIGPLPLLTALHGAAYQMALIALDLQTAGALAAPPELLNIGLDALVDTTGAFAARAGVTAAITARVPERQFGTGAQGADWCTRDISTSPRNSTGPTVVSDVAGVLALTSGRADIARLYRNGSLRLQDIPGLLRWVAVVEEVPSLPGGATLARAGRYLAGISSLVSRLPRRPGRRRSDREPGSTSST